MNERTRGSAPRGATTRPQDGFFGELIALWSGLADALLLGTLHAALAPEPVQSAPALPRRRVEAPVGIRDRAA